MCQEVLGIRDIAAEQDTQSPNSHKTYMCMGVGVKETENKYVGSKMNAEIFQIVIHAMKKSKEGHGIRCPRRGRKTSQQKPLREDSF